VGRIPPLQFLNDAPPQALDKGALDLQKTAKVTVGWGKLSVNQRLEMAIGFP
jgi:hypothetical protein